VKDSAQREFSLRPATDQDLGQIVQVEQKSHAQPWSHADFNAELGKPYCRFLVFTDDETDSLIAGYLVAHLLFDAAELLNLVIAPEWRRQGFAQAMLRKLTDLTLAQGIKRIFLDVRKSNDAALQLYQCQNYSIRQVRRQFYSNGEDSYQMALDLGAP
jgi:ribosomal-protein-alanine N-acetyltransferase